MGRGTKFEFPLGASWGTPNWENIMQSQGISHWENIIQVINLLKKYLYDNGISTEIHYPVPPNKQKALEGYFNNNYPISEEIHKTTLSLPISYATKVEDVERVCAVLNNF